MRPKKIYYNTLVLLLCFCICDTAYAIRMPGSGRDIAQPVSRILFLENKGQIIDQNHNHRNDIDFSISTGGVKVFIGDGQLHYQWAKLTAKAEEDVTVNSMQMPAYKTPAKQNSDVSIYRLDVKLVGANVNAVPIAEDKQDYHENYYLPQCPRGATANGYRKITYKNIYPNIDWVLYIDNSKIKSQDSKEGLKYDFVVHPGGRVSDIKIQYEGDTSLQLRNGAITAITPFGSVNEDVPYAYENDTKAAVNVNYKLQDHTVSFEAGDYSGTLVIDPAIQWATYCGEYMKDDGYAVAYPYYYFVIYTAYLAGSASSFRNIATLGAHQYNNAGQYFAGGTDAFISAYTTSGLQRWGTYYGGSGDDCIKSAACIHADNGVIVAGGTTSDTGIATAGAYQSTFSGPVASPLWNNIFSDGMIAKFDKDGVLVWGTYFGGTGKDDINAIATDTADNIYITGMTDGHDGIATPGAHKTTMNFSGYADAFLAMLDKTGHKQWGTYYGSQHGEIGTGVVCDYEGNVYMTGSVYEDSCGINVIPEKINAISTPGAHQRLPGYIGCIGMNSPAWDGFLVKFDGTGKRSWGTFYGGGDNDFANAIAYDSTSFVMPDGTVSKGLVYLAGHTGSPDKIVTAEGFDNSYSPCPAGAQPGDYCSDGFVASFTPTGKRYWGTYLGGNGVQDAINGLCVNTNGTLDVVGTTNSAGLGTNDAYQKNNNGRRDAFIAVFSQAAMQSFTYYGGEDDDYGYSIAAHGDNNMFLAGSTNSFTGIANRSLVGVLQQPDNGSTPTPFIPGGALITDGDAFIAHFRDFVKAFMNIPITPINAVCAGLTTRMAYEVHDAPGGNIFQAGNVFTLQMSDTAGSFVHADTLVTVPGVAITSTIDFTMPSNAILGRHKIRLIASRPVFISNEYYITVSKSPYIQSASSNTPLCEGDSLALHGVDTVTDPIAVRWWTRLDGSVIGYANDTFKKNLTLSDRGKYIYNSQIGPCLMSRFIDVVVNPVPGINKITSNGLLCPGDSLKFEVTDTSKNDWTYTWSGPGGFTSAIKNAVRMNIPQDGGGNYSVHYTRLNCSNDDTISVTVKPKPEKPEGGSNSPICYGDSIVLHAESNTAGVSYTWDGYGGFISKQQNPRVGMQIDPGVVSFAVRTELNKCISETDSVYLTVKPLPDKPDANSNSPLKAGQDLELTATSTTGAKYSWEGPEGYRSKEQNPVYKNVPYTATGSYYVTANLDGCIANAEVVVIVNITSDVSLLIYPNPNQGTFTIKGNVHDEQQVPVQITNSAGQIVYETQVKTNRRQLNNTITLPGALANGVYTITMRVDRETRSVRFALNK